MISEKGLCKILKSAYKNGGYSVIQVRRKVESTTQTWQRNEIILNGATWAVRCVTEALGGVLASLSAAEAPWDKAFREAYCQGCGRENCDACPHEEYRNNPVWWLRLAAK